MFDVAGPVASAGHREHGVAASKPQIVDVSRGIHHVLKQRHQSEGEALQATPGRRHAVQALVERVGDGEALLAAWVRRVAQI